MSQPMLQGSGQWQYRLYTVEHIPFEAFPSYSEGGPATVTHTGWAVSAVKLYSEETSAASHEDGAHVLNVYRLEGSKLVNHPLDGTQYPSSREAKKAAYAAGLLAFQVYERNAA